MKHGAPIYNERLRLVLAGIGKSMFVGGFLSTLLLIVFWLTTDDPAMRPLLVAWYVAFLMIRLALVVYSRRMVKENAFASAPLRVTRTLLYGKIIEGLVWGGLVWIVVRGTASANTALVLAVMAAISSNAVSLLSPLIRLYLALVLPMLLLASLRFGTLDGLVYKAMGISCLLYFIGQLAQAQLLGERLVDTIRLRFQNLDLIERLKVETALASSAREAAEQANVAKSRFLAAASHDLRQPVHALGLFLEALSLQHLGGSQRDILDSAKAASLASSDMLDTLLDFSRIEAGVIRPRQRPFLLQELFHKMEVELAPQADAKGLIYRSRETSAIAHSDPALLELILRNLISNAIRYTHRGGVLVGCRVRGDTLAIEVYDTGIGIDPDQHDHVFREFHQLGNPERDRRKGLGLGLAIVDRLARSLEHPVNMRSRPGSGTLFRVRVPQGCALLPVQALGTPALGHATLAGKQILVVDDDEAVRSGMRHLLGSWGCGCHAVESLDEALSLSGMRRPDVIVCDYRLRERQNGAEAIRRLRQHYRHDVPALLITGDTAPERLREASDSGIPLLHKPVAVGELRKALLERVALLA